MVKDLTNSQRERQNVLNNRFALEKAEEHLKLGGIEYAGETVFTKQQVAQLFEISDATIERYVANHGEELRANGYITTRGIKLKEFKSLFGVALVNEGNKVPILGLFPFRAVLNLAMLLTESERARMVRSKVLDLVIDVMAERSGGHTKYINQR